MEPAVRGARTQSGIATAPDSRIPDCGSAKPRLRRLKAQPPGTEFLDAETGRQNSRQIALAPGETKIREMSGRKSPQKRPIWRRIGNVRFAETGWWCAQSDANRSPLDIRLRTGNFLQNSANNRLSGGLWRLRIGNSTEIPDSCRQAQALSSYCAKQVIEAEYWH